MGKRDLDLKSYLSDRRRYADIYNGSIFHGAQLLKAKELEPVETVRTKADKEGFLERTSDIVMRQKTTGDIFALWILENNTLIVYWGKEPWDGPRSLHDFLDFGNEDMGLYKELKKLVPEYPLHILDLNTVTDYSKYETELKTVFELYRHRNDKRKFKEYVEEHEECRHLDEESYRMIGRLTNSEELLLHAGKEERKDKDMSNVIAELIEDGRLEGLKEGISQGMSQGISQGMKALVETCKEFGCTKEEAITKLMEKCTLSRSEAEKYAEEYGY